MADSIGIGWRSESYLGGAFNHIRVATCVGILTQDGNSKSAVIFLFWLLMSISVYCALQMQIIAGSDMNLPSFSFKRSLRTLITRPHSGHSAPMVWLSSLKYHIEVPTNPYILGGASLARPDFFFASVIHVHIIRRAPTIRTMMLQNVNCALSIGFPHEARRSVSLNGKRR
jgi:hypothetical protein